MTTRTYAYIQRRYLDAKVTYQSALAVHADALEALGFHALLDTAENTTLVTLEIAAQRQSHLDEAMDAFLKAEKALFAWAQTWTRDARLAKHAQAARTIVDTLFTSIQKYPHLKEKLAAICLALDLKK